MSLLFDALLALVLLALGWRVVATRAPVPAAIAFIAYGLTLALAWVRLAAVDVALTEAAVGGGITGLVLLRAAGRSPATETAPGTVQRVVAGGLSAAVALALAGVVLALPEPAPTLAPQVVERMPATGLGNPVTGVLLVFRALDTLLETVVLLVGLLAVWALAQDRAWQAPPPPLWADAPHPAQDLLARMLAPVGVLVAIYMFWAGADVPGGAFQGGAVLAAMWLLAMTAGLARPPRAGALWLRAGLLAGPFGFLLVGVSGWATAGVFLGYPAGWEKQVIVAVEVLITLSIGVTLALMVLEPPGTAGEQGGT